MRHFIPRLFFLCVFFQSCSKYDKVGQPIDKIYIYCFKTTGPEGTEVYFSCGGGNFECPNVPITYDLKKTEKALYLEFGDTYGNECNSRPEGYPAHVNVYLGKLNVGNYIFDITNRKKTLHCNLKVEEDKYIFSNTSSGTVTIEEGKDPFIVYF